MMRIWTGLVGAVLLAVGCNGLNRITVNGWQDDGEIMNGITFVDSGTFPYRKRVSGLVKVIDMNINDFCKEVSLFRNDNIYLVDSIIGCEADEIHASIEEKTPMMRFIIVRLPKDQHNVLSREIEDGRNFTLRYLKNLNIGVILAEPTLYNKLKLTANHISLDFTLVA